jgi:hypothetical protein
VVLVHGYRLGRSRCGLRRWQFPRGDLRQTKVQNLRLPAFGQKQVRRFQIAMDDARSVRHLERVRHLHPKIQKLFKGDGFSLDAVLQRRPFQAFHDNEEPVLMLTNVIDGANVWMV